MKNYKHIIWDWNGTLLNDTQLSRLCINQLLADYGMPTVSDPEHQEHFDFPILNYYQKIGFDITSEKLVKELNTRFLDYYNQNRHNGFNLHKGAQELLESLKSQGLTQSILSAHFQDALNKEVEHHGIKSHFQIIMGRKDNTAGCKRGIAKEKMERLTHLRVKDILYIGDTTHDYDVSQMIGVDCLLLDHGYQSRKRLEACNVPVLESFEPLKEMLLSGQLI